MVGLKEVADDKANWTKASDRWAIKTARGWLVEEEATLPSYLLLLVAGVTIFWSMGQSWLFETVKWRIPETNWIKHIYEFYETII